MTKQLRVRILNLLRLEAYFELPIHRVNIILDILILAQCISEDYFGKIRPTDGAFVPLTQDTHARAADEADRVVALSDAPHKDLVHAKLTRILPILRVGQLACHSLSWWNIHLVQMVSCLVTTHVATLKK